MLENSSWHENGVAQCCWIKAFQDLWGSSLGVATPHLHVLVSWRDLNVLWDRDPVCVVHRFPLRLPTEFLVWDKEFCNDALVSFSKAPSIFFLSSLSSLHGCMHLLLLSRLRNATRILSCVDSLNIKWAESHFHRTAEKSVGHARHIHSICSLIEKTHLKSYTQ